MPRVTKEDIQSFLQGQGTGIVQLVEQRGCSVIVNTDPLLTTREVAALLHNTPRTIDRWIEEEGFPYIQVKPGGKKLHRARAVIRWIRKRERSRRGLQVNISGLGAKQEAT